MWIVPFYLVDFVVFAAALFCLIYFRKNQRSPLVRASHSNVDNGILLILCIFCLLPIIHFGKFSSAKCVSQWLMQNVMYAIYCGLLFTKRPYVGNTRVGQRIACEQAHHMSDEHVPISRARQERTYVYPALFTMLPVVITMATVPFSVTDKVNIPACPSHLDLCPIQGNLSVSASMAYTWSLLLSLTVLTLTENIGGKKSWKNPWLILIGFLSYTVLVCFSYLNLLCSYISWLTFVGYLLILINPVLCLITLFLPKIHFIITCRVHLKRFQKSSRSKGSSHQVFSAEKVTVNQSHDAGSHEGPITGPHAGLHASTVYTSARPISSVSDASRMLNIQKSIRIVSNLFKSNEPEYQLLRQPSLYDNVPGPLITWDNISQSSFATALASDVDEQSVDENDDSLELAEITLEELKEMTAFLKGLKSSDV